MDHEFVGKIRTSVAIKANKLSTEIEAMMKM